MNLEEMKSIWSEMSNDLAQQKLTTNKLIMEMTQIKYDHKIKSISRPETIGAIICFGMAFYLLLNFGKLDSLPYQLSGIVCLLYLFLLPYFVLRSIKDMSSLNIVDYNYRELIQTFEKRKRRFLQLQKMGVLLNVVFMILVLPVAGKVMSNKDIFANPAIWYWYVAFGLVFLFFFSRWGLNYYRNMSSSAEKILKDQEDNTFG